MNFERVWAWAPQWLSVVRIMSALLFLEHGTQKFFNFPPAAEPQVLTALSGIQGVIEVVGGVLLALGLFTRPVAFILSGDMAVAYFMAHAPQNFFPVINQGDSAILYCFIFLYFFFAGGGAWSVDAARRGTGLTTP
jgi:putative oxidoreductase